MKIPSRIKIKNKVVYELVWVDEFADPDTLGECRFDFKQIVLKRNQSERETLKTLFHELLHCLEFERNIKIPHKTIYQLEDAIYYLIFHNDWE